MVNITQPALSRQIRLLEDELGVTLFQRDSRGAPLTDEGRKLLEGAQRIFAEIKAIQQSLSEPSGDIRGTIVVGLSFSVAPAFATRLLRSVREKYPGITLRLIEESFTGFGDEWLNWIRSNHLDLALLHSESTYPDLDCAILAREDLHLIGKYCANPESTEVPLHLLGNFPLATFTFNNPLRRLIEAIAMDSGVELDIRLESDSWAEILDYIRQGKAYSINAKTALTDEARRNELTTYKIIDPAISRQLMLVSSGFRQPSTAVNAIHKLLRASAKDLISQGALEKPRTLDATKPMLAAERNEPA